MPKDTRHVAFVLTPAVERALVPLLGEVPAERGRRVTWDQAFRRLPAMAGRPVEEGRAQYRARYKDHASFRGRPSYEEKTWPWPR